MSCEERERLKAACAAAGAAFDAIREAPHTRIGVSSKEEFLVLDRTAEEAWAEMQRASQALDRHMREHGC